MIYAGTLLRAVYGYGIAGLAYTWLTPGDQTVAMILSAFAVGAGAAGFNKVWTE